MDVRTGGEMEKTAEWGEGGGVGGGNSARMGGNGRDGNGTQRKTPVELSLLSHPLLDHHPAYQCLKQYLLSFHRLSPPLSSPLHPNRSPAWLLRFYSSLYQSLLTIAYSLDVAMVQPLYQWFRRYAKIDEKDGDVPIDGSVSPPPRACRWGLAGGGRLATDPNSYSERKITVRSVSPVAFPAKTPENNDNFSLERVESRAGRRIQEFEVREVREGQDKRAQRKAVQGWGKAWARMEQQLAGKQERKTVKVRKIPSSSFITEASTYQPDTTAETPNITLPDIIQCKDLPPSDWDTSRTMAEGLEERDMFPAVMNKVERARAVQRNVVKGVCGAGYFYSGLDSLSVYHPQTPSTLLRKEGKVPAVRTLVPSSSAGQRFALISKVRRPLITQRVPCSYATLAKGLLIPGDLPEMLLEPGRLPSGGEYFTSNPFFPLPAKKKQKIKRPNNRR